MNDMKESGHKWLSEQINEATNESSNIHAWFSFRQWVFMNQ